MSDAAKSDSPPLREGKNPAHHRERSQINRDDLSPMMRHYVDLKDEYPHTLLLYRMGDFYETFLDDAVTIAQALELVLTSRLSGNNVGRVAMAGIPHHQLERYCRMLVGKGYAVAICDQMEDPAQAQGLVKREVTRVITPGTVLDEGMLSARSNNFLAAFVLAGNNWGMAYADISTGEFLTTQHSDRDQLAQELLRLQPSEVLFPTDAPDIQRLLRPGETSEYLPEGIPNQFCFTMRTQSSFTLPEAKQRIQQVFGVRSLEGMGCEHLPLAIRAAGGLLVYLEETQKENHIPLQPLCTYILSEYMVLDHQSRRNLEITRTSRDGTFHGSLLWALDQTRTAMGGRALKRWLLQPLLNSEQIQARQETISELSQNTAFRGDLQSLLQQIYDLERLAGRAGSGTANARDLVALAESLDRLTDLANLVADGKSEHLQAVQMVPSTLEKLGVRLRSHLHQTPPISLTEGNLIRDGVNADLDRLRQQAVSDQQWIANLEKDERERTGIPTLKVGFNKAFGYYIGISRAKSAQAPDDYIRKQTLTNEERYITPELKEREARIFNAQTEQFQLEYDIFVDLRSEVGEWAGLIRTVAANVAAVDVLAGLAEVAIYQGYCRPKMAEGREISLVDGRHPVVEKSLPPGFFVPNAAQLGTPGISPDLIILTGPNASGKSCYLRQVGLIQLMAQVGSFVPAQSAGLGICDRIFTRVGAVDDLATGQSTFMVEMNETANILNHATERSLVLLDEIGRGTATFDGLSIAWSVAEYLAIEIRARTIFATHYHELNELATLVENVANYQVLVKELPDQIIFLHQVHPGGASRSYGIEAGRLAGLPPSVIKRAKQVMTQIEKHSKIAVGLRKGSPHAKPPVNSGSKTVPAEESQQFELPF
ncbi:DNA mismatch repair protein MutS [Acaryochloris thomasi RCC1774]|uniref:DNA mismatch repair protein MutS n=1 Tax=Acaryochloris thomasi RCC1774 TaxID=1764569 RepID=A0A2W1JM65_9CYAN|nr:DNA mismatch repair protein MutS [Acaryochloris thomasi]PZD74460.1 DNA mismatch repair protein MutS [Acaryochloris thomasi RCC1774]